MTHPLTPREKVARIVDPEAFDHPTVHPQHLVARRAVSLSKADAILTALASGSGDHAELARLAEAAIPYLYDGWSYTPPSEPLTSGRITGSGSGPVLAVVQWPVPTMDHALCGYDASQPVGAFIAAANPATVLALLAENAALRDSVVKANDGFEEYERRFYLEQDRATEAERKLAEAVQVIRDIAETPYTGADWPRSRAATYIASKEAERG